MLFQFREKHSFTKECLVALLLLYNSFSWYFIGQLIVTKLAKAISTDSSASLYLQAAFPISIIISALIGSVIWSKICGSKNLHVWLILGTVISIFPATSIANSFVSGIIIIVALGTSLGLGMPSLLSYFSKSIPIENKGKVAGVTFFMITASVPLLIMGTSAFDLATFAILFAVWRSWSIPILLAFPLNRTTQLEREREPPFLNVFQNRPFVLYFLAWFMFSMIDGFESHVLFTHKQEFGLTMNIAEPIIAAFTALIAGIFADWIGRKKIIISGFVLLGVAHAVLGIASQFWISWIIFFVINGISIGLLWTMFTIVLWGELARASEKYYAIGETPFFLTQVLSLLFAPYVALIPEISAFSLAAFFLFIAVIPLLYAPETLPEKRIQERQLKIYTEEALKLKQKVEQKQT